MRKLLCSTYPHAWIAISIHYYTQVEVVWENSSLSFQRVWRVWVPIPKDFGIRDRRTKHFVLSITSSLWTLAKLFQLFTFKRTQPYFSCVVPGIVEEGRNSIVRQEQESKRQSPISQLPAGAGSSSCPHASGWWHGRNDVISFRMNKPNPLPQLAGEGFFVIGQFRRISVKQQLPSPSVKSLTTST